MDWSEWSVLLRGGVTTLEITAGAWVTSLVLGLLVAAIRESRFAPAVRVVDVLTNVVRSIPELVLLYVFYFGVAYTGIRIGSLTAAIVALGISEAAFTSEYFRAGMATVPQTQRQAGYSLGLGTVAVFRWVVLPQALPFAVPPLLNTFVGLLKTATLASAVGAVEILYAGQDLMNRTGQVLLVTTVIVVLYVVVTLPLTGLVGRLERRARARSARA